MPDGTPASAEPLRKTPGLKAALAAGVLVYAILFVLTTFPRAQEAEAQAARYFSATEIERGLRYSSERRLFFWASTGVQLAFLTVLVFTGAARKLADRCGQLVGLRRPGGDEGVSSAGQFGRLGARLGRGLRWLATVLLVGAFCFVAAELLVLPIRLGRLAHARAWGMTDRSVLSWFEDYAKSLGIAAVMGAVLLAGLYALIRTFPRRWWLLAATGSTVLGVFYAYMLPVVINPLFNTFTPLDDPYLLRRVRALAERAGVHVEAVLVMDASRQGKHTNAYFTGFGSTRRIVLYDTLLRPLHTLPAASAAAVIGLAAVPQGPAQATAVVLDHRSEVADEIESILAHEIGHWEHDHILKGIALAGAGAYAGLFLVALILRRAVGRAPFALRGPDDAAGVPLLLLLSVVGSWLVWPVENVVSRHFESQADAAALRLADHPGAFIAAEKRLARDNLGNVAPNPFTVWLFASHPPAVERIRMAEEWARRKREGRKE